MEPVLNEIARHLVERNHPYRLVVCAAHPRGMVNMRNACRAQGKRGSTVVPNRYPSPSPQPKGANM